MPNPARLAKETPDQRERRLAKARAYIAAHPEKASAAKTKWRLANPEYAQAYYQANSDRVKARAKNWRIANPERKATNNEAWAAANPEKARQSAIQSKRRRRTRADVRLAESVSTQIWFALKGDKAGRKWETLVSFTLADLRTHLERQLTDGMTWAKYGQWHIDHIRPLAMFTFTTADDPGFKDAWALTNLRPLWAIDNVKKRDQRTHLI